VGNQAWELDQNGEKIVKLPKNGAVLRFNTVD
jgi:hypothetical protein